MRILAQAARRFNRCTLLDGKKAFTIRNKTPDSNPKDNLGYNAR